MRLIYTFMISVLSIALTGCGIVQSAYEGTVDLSNSVFSWDIRTIHLDITARAELNMDDDNLSSPVVIRIYQLKNADMFNSVFYEDLVDRKSTRLNSSHRH